MYIYDFPELSPGVFVCNAGWLSEGKIILKRIAEIGTIKQVVMEPWIGQWETCLNYLEKKTGLPVVQMKAGPLEPAALEPAALEPAALEPAALEPAALEPAALEPAALEPGSLVIYDTRCPRSVAAFEKQFNCTLGPYGKITLLDKNISPFQNETRGPTVT